ncbi:MAG: DUF1552 domain-containing protein, partial [Bryobacteraceae bacterium]
MANGKRTDVSRRTLLKGLTLSRLPVWIGLPPLDIMFNRLGTAYAAEPASAGNTDKPIDTRFLFWFNGNGIPEKYWIPEDTGSAYTLTPCLEPLAPFKKDVHVITGLDNPAARLPGP